MNNLVSIFLTLVEGCVGAAPLKDGGYRLDMASGKSRVATDEEVLSALKAEAWARIKADRAAAVLAPTMETPFGVFDAGAEALDNIIGALLGRREAEHLMGQALDPIEWTLADDSSVALTTDQLAQVAVLLLSRGDAAHKKGRMLREQVKAAQSIEALGAVAW